MAKTIIKGLQDLRTVSGSMDDRSVPFRAYMKLSVLEMEKLRRGKEKANSLARVADIDARFRDIEREGTALLQALRVRDVEKPSGIRKTGTKPGSGGGAFKIRY